MNTKKGEHTAPEKSDVALREEAVLQFWKEHDIFNKTLTKDSPNGDFVFYDGPPFATGLPHYGHILAGTIKDAIPRFWTMNGYHVPRKWGWDCHGLPVENLIEKKLGLATKRDIEDYGVQNFNEAARGTVMEYADDWKKIIPRMGRWADMDDDYKTMDASYTESVWWVFSQLHKKGLVYEGFKTMHLCPRCGTTLSNFEVNQGYKDIKDIAITVKLPLLDDAGKVTDTSLLVWTTTPWTMPGNMAAAVNNEHEYVKVKIATEEGEEFVVLAKARLAQLGDVPHTVVEAFNGSELVGKKYEPPFAYLADEDMEGKEKAWTIYHADYVELGEEGTGAVHLAPAYGDDDMRLAQEHGVPIVHHVDNTGHFMDFVTDFAGQLVKPKDDDASGIDHKDTDIEILKALQASGKIFKKENITHSYPHCWRCDTPLLNYATTSWFVEVTKIKDQLVAENNKVQWVPEHVGRARFGKWLEGARDWAVSRQRYWGAPLPIWRNAKTGDFTVVGSLAELQEYVPRTGNTFTIARHGESAFNTQGLLSGRNGVQNSLTATGVEQSKQAAAALHAEGGIDLIYYSPLDRTKETAEIIAQELGVSPDALIADERIAEMQFGEFEEKSVTEYLSFFSNGEGRLTKTPEGGESWSDVKKRVGDFLYEVNATSENKRILVVAHNGTLQMLQAAARGDSFEDTAQAIDADVYDLANAELRHVPFIPVPHNNNYELDFHRPYIDDIALFDGETKLERVPDVFDCWFESGSMPYGQKHYLGEAVDGFDPKTNKGFPADFIAEGLDQTRGWFYSLIVLGTAIFGTSPFKNVIVNGLILAEDGKKMSKSLQNYPDPVELADRTGVDAMRFYLLSSSVIRGEDLSFSEKEVLEIQRKNIGRLNNVLTMYQMFADDTQATTTSENVLDQWIFWRLKEMVNECTAGYTGYELDKATRPITDFIDDLSVWYLRRSRERLKGDDTVDAKRALGTLRHVLQELSLVMAPVMPFFAEQVWQVVKPEGSAESVHLADWPLGVSIDEDSIKHMALTRTIVSAALEARTKVNIKVRQPLQHLKVAGEQELSEEYIALIADEVNVKEVSFGHHLDTAVELDTKITPELKAEGDVREFMRAVQSLRKDAGLEQDDRVILQLQASQEGEALVSLFAEDIKKTVGATALEFTRVEVGAEVTAGEHSLTVALVKVAY